MVLIGILLVLFVTSVGAAVSPDINSLIVWQMLSGLALGAYPPLMFSFLLTSCRQAPGAVIVLTAGIASFEPAAMIKSRTMDHRWNLASR